MRSRSTLFALAIATCIGSSDRLAAAITFPVTIVDPGNQYLAYHNDVRLAIQAAGALWDEVLEEAGDVTIEVSVTLGLDIATASGTSTTSAFVRNDGVRDIWDQSAAAEIRTGVDPNPGVADVEFNVGADYLTDEMWFDPNPFARAVPVPSNKTDAVSVFIHEFGHALAFNGWIDWATGTRPPDFQSTFDALTTSPAGNYRFQGERSKHLYRAPVPLTTGNIYHFGNAEGEAGHDLILDVMNGVVSLRGVRDEISGYVLAVAEDLNLPVRVNWDRYSHLAFKQSGAIKTLQPNEDEDGDRLTNFGEFVYGTDPFNPNSVEHPLFSVVPSGPGKMATIQIPLIRSLRGFDIHAESGTTLTSFTTDAIYRPEDANASIQWVTHDSGQLLQPDWFGRLRAFAPPNLLPAARKRDALERPAPIKLITGPKPIHRECPGCRPKSLSRSSPLPVLPCER